MRVPNPFRFLIRKIYGARTLMSLYENWPYVILSRIPGMVRQPSVVYKTRDGIRLEIRSDEIDGSIADSIFLGEYDFPGFGIQPKDTVIDIGAHIGTFTLYAAARAIDGKVFAYDPHSANFALLRKNVELNAFTNIRLYRYAVLDRRGTRRLYLPRESTALANLFRKTLKYESVPTTTLKDVMVANQITECNLLKVDCEGAEFDILTSTPASILRRIEKVVVESHLDGERESELLRHLRKNGFVLVHRKTNQMRPDILFVRRRMGFPAPAFMPL